MRGAWPCLLVVSCCLQPSNAPAQNRPVQAKDIIQLSDAALGAVKFNHKQHAELKGVACETCHHESKPEKPQTSPNQACRECHSKPLPQGMKTSRQAAFHKSAAQSGTCIDCHKKAVAEGKKPPLKCAECHLKEAKPVAGGIYGQPRHSAPPVHALGVSGYRADAVF